MSTLLSLPNELSFQIFDDLDGADLLVLAQSCRRLNTIVIPYYLSRHKITDPHTSITFNGRNSRIFPFLVISVHLTSVDKIHANFSIHTDLDKIRWLKRLVNKLTSVGSVQLSLHSFGPFRNQKDGDRFIEAIHGLFTSIITRSCISLTVRGPDMYLPFAEEQKVSHSPIPPLVRMLRKSPPKQDVRDSKPPPKQDVHDSLVLDISHASKLAELRIHSSMLFHPLFLRGPIKLINASPMTTLSLTNSSRTTPLWDDLLLVHCPSLSEFYIADHFWQIPFSSLAAFLIRHQTITLLECKGLFQLDHEHSMVSLPRLTKLVSTYEFFVHLLEHATAFPSLRDITLKSYPRQYTELSSPSVVNTALECVGTCSNELELSLMFDRDKDDLDLTSWFDVDVNDTRVERSLHNVVSLKLLVGIRGQRFSNKMLRVFPKWLGLFPALRIVTFHSSLPPKRDTRLNIARSVIHACSRLDTLRINQETHTVAAWLAMENGFIYCPPRI